jgi:hypothetical protein
MFSIETPPFKGAPGTVPPLYFAVGASESILGDSVRVAQHAAQGGVDVILEAQEQLDQQWMCIENIYNIYTNGNIRLVVNDG